jgi:molybdopterin-guanine dinucleotide biosynthesis protein A
MGADKAALRLAGATLLERAVGELDTIASRTLLACGGSPRYADLGRPLVLDAFSDGGPLAGLEAALARSETDWLAAIACDMPRANGRVLLALLERADSHGLDACLLETEKGVEPLCAVYRKTCLKPIRAALAAGERRVISFFGVLKPDGSPLIVGSLLERELPSELAAIGVAVNVNTPRELDIEVQAGGSR